MKVRFVSPILVAMAALTTAQAQYQTPHIQALNPPSIAPGAQVKLTITGYGFNQSPSVQINGATVPSTLVSQIEIQLNYNAPSSPTGLLVTVTNDVGAISNAISVPVSTYNPEIGLTAPGEFSFMFSGLAIASFNGDGHPDIATTARGSFEPDGNAFLIVLDVEQGNNGSILAWGPHDYDFTATLQNPTSDYASAITAGDFNGDGRPDVVIATACGAGAACTGNTDLYLAVLLNQSAGSRSNQKFSSPVYTPLPAQATALAIGNFTGSGSVDLAVAAGDSIYLFRGEGNGSFQQVSTFNANLGTPVLGLVAADFNQDGISDILAITGTSEELILSSGGQPNFSATSISDGAGPIQVVLGDFNNDGLVDAAILESSSVKILSSAGNGTFNTYTAASVPSGTTAIQAGDFNTDGYLDLMLFGNAASVLVNYGDGAWPTVITPTAYGQFYPSTTLAAADFNLDGKVDIAAIGQNSADLAAYFQGSAITFSPASLVVNQQASQTSPPQTINVSSSGSLPLVFFGTPMINDESGLGYFYIVSNNCSGTLPNGSSCQVQVTYTAAPFVVGATADLTFYSNAGGSNVDEQNYSMVGNNLVSLGALSGKLTFPNTTIGTTSASMTETLQSTGTEALAINSITIQSSTNAGPNDFQIVSNSCGTQLAVNASCQISVTFTPSTEKAETAFLTVTDNSSNQSGTTQTVKLIGTGTAPNVPDLTFSTTSLAFGNLQVGQTSGTASVAVTNIGADPVVFTSVAITGTNTVDFALVSGSNACTYGSFSLAAGASCNVYVTFTPNTNGAFFAAVTLTDNNLGMSGATQAISLSGSAGYPAPLLDILSPVSLLNSAANAGFTLKLQGANLDTTSQVTVNGQTISSTFANGTLQAAVPSGLITAPGTEVIRATNAGATGSNPLFLPIGAAAVGAPEYVNASGSPFGTVADSQQLTVGDFNGDGKPDLVISNSGVSVIYLSQGNGTFTESAALIQGVVYTAPGEYTIVVPFSTVAGDFNGDGKLDLASICQPFGVVIWLGDGQGAFSPQAVDPSTGLPLANLTGAQPQFGAAADFNGDGILDIATADLDTGISILLGQGNGAFNPFASANANQGAPWGIVAGDFNNDGIVDLAVSNFQYNTVSVLLGNGQGGFTAQSAVATGTAPLGLTAGDFNGDGKLDLAVANAGSSTLSILLGNGNGTFTAAASPATGAGPESVAVGDLNDDGNLDLAVANSGGNSVTVLLGSGNGTFAAAGAATPVGNSPVAISIADWNNDGLLDLAAANSSSGTISIFLSAVPVGTPSPNAISFGSQNAGVVSAAQTVALNNTGNGPLIVTAISLGGVNAGDFAETNTCGTLPATINAGANCTIGVTYDPSVAGIETATLTITDNSSGTTGSTQTVALSATGVVTVTVAPASLAFGYAGVGESTNAKTVQISNESAIAVTITGISIVGANAADFTKKSACGASLAAGASCTTSVVFKPSAGGPRKATLAFSDSGTGSPQTVALSGTGTSDPAAELSATSLTFPTTKVGSTSSAQIVTITNDGDANLTISKITSSGDFAQKNNCTSAIVPGKSCGISVTFTPTKTGTRTGVITIADNGVITTLQVKLTGTGD